MEKRKYVRQPLDLNAWIVVDGGTRHACQIKDFSLGGVFVICGKLSHDGSSDSQPVELQFAVESGGAKKQHLLTGRLARTFKAGYGVEFVNPDPATLLIMQELANKAQSQKSARRKATSEPPLEDVPNRLGIVKSLKEMVSRFLNEGLQTLFPQAIEGLFEKAGKASNQAMETECFDARREIDNIRSLIEQSFVTALLDRIEKPGSTQLSGPEEPPQEDGEELTLVDPEKFQDWLRMKQILEKAGPKFKDTQYELHARLSAVLNNKIDEFNNPIGLMEICGSFHHSVQELGASRIARAAIFDAFENSIVSKLGVLYSEVTTMLVSKGILPTVAPPKHTVKKHPRSATAKAAGGTASPGASGGTIAAAAAGTGHAPAGTAPLHSQAPLTGASPAGVSAGGNSGGSGSAASPAGSGNPGAAPGHTASPSHVGGTASAPAHAVSSGSIAAAPTPSAGAASNSPTPGVQAAPARGSAAAAPAPAADGPGDPAEAVGSGVSPADTAVVQAVPGARVAAPGAPQGVVATPGQVAQPSASAYQTVHTLMGLQRQVASAGAPAGVVPGAGTAGAAAGPSYARNEVMSALSSVQQLSGAGGAVPRGRSLKEHIQSALEAQQPDGVAKQLGEAEDAAIDLTSGLVESIVDDVLVSDQIRSEFKRLEIPLLKALMKNETFFADSKHPARRVVDQLGALTIPEGKAGAQLREKVNQVVNEISSNHGDGESEFANAAPQLESILNEQMAAYENNVRNVVEGCERQESKLQTLKKGKSSRDGDTDGSGHTSKREVPKELQQWLERAGRIQVGDRVAIDKAGRTHHETLAWVSGDQDKYVFVDGLGEKASSMIRQQLAMLLKRGLLRVLAESAAPAMERGMHEIMRRMHKNLVNKATQDPTTGLLNEKAFLDRVDRAITDAIQTSSQHVLCYLDLDHFGQINEKWGDTAGDKLLKRFGIVLKKNLGEKGVTARLPGDEFGLILFRCVQERGFEFADRLRRAVASARCYWKGESLPLSVSIGVVPITSQSENVKVLMDAARAACVKAKESGRDCVELSRPELEKSTTQTFKHDTLVVTKILEGDRLQLQAQRVEPIGENADGKPHYEIQLGLRNISGELVPPDPFIRAAERSKQVTKVDRWVIQSALQWMAKNKRRLLKLGGFAINLSGVSLNDQSLTEFVMDQFMKTKVPPGKVIFEVTETAAIDRLSAAEEFLRVMKDFGCRFSLDDFGTGQSSYDYLQQLSVDFVKIDGMFVKELESNLSDFAMVKSIAEIGRFTGKKTIADCVENETILNKLKEIGVDYVQGALVEKPLPLQELR